MATPYLTYQNRPTAAATATGDDSRVRAAQVTARGKLAGEEQRTFRETTTQMSKYDMGMNRERNRLRSDLLKAQTSAASILTQYTEVMQNARVHNYQAKVDAAREILESGSQALTRIVSSRYKVPETMSKGLDSAILRSAAAGWELVAGDATRMQNSGEDLALPGFVNYVIDKTLGSEYDIFSDPAELEAALRDAGLAADEVQRALVVIEDARGVHRGQSIAIDGINEQIKYLKDVAEEEVEDQAELDKRLASSRKALNAALSNVTSISNADPETLRRMISEDAEEGKRQEFLFDVAQTLWAKIQAGDVDDNDEAQLGRLLADDSFRLWAADNGMSEIGYPKFDKDGEIVGAIPGGDLVNAFVLYDYQTKHENRWGRAMKPGGGQFSGEIVEVSYLPKGTPMVAEGPDGLVVRAAGKVYLVEEDGSLAETEASAAKGLDFGLVQKKGGQALTVEDLATPGIGQTLELPANPTEADQFRALYARRFVGEREHSQAALLSQYRNSYIAAADENGRREVFTGDMQPIVRRVGGDEDPAKRRSRAESRTLRRAISGRGPEFDSLAKPYDEQTEYEFNGIRILGGGAADDTTLAKWGEIIDRREPDIFDSVRPTADIIGGDRSSLNDRAREKALLPDEDPALPETAEEDVSAADDRPRRRTDRVGDVSALVERAPAPGAEGATIGERRKAWKDERLAPYVGGVLPGDVEEEYVPDPTGKLRRKARERALQGS